MTSRLAKVCRRSCQRIETLGGVFDITTVVVVVVD